MASSGCIFKALMVVSLVTSCVTVLHGAVRAQAPAQPARVAPPPAAAPTPPPTAAVPAPPAALAPPAVAPAAAAAQQPAAAQSGEPVYLGDVTAPVVYGPEPIPAPPPDRYAFPSASSARAQQPCPPGRCGLDCRSRCGDLDSCLSDGSCDDEVEDLGREHKGLLLRATTGWGLGRLSANKLELHEPSFVLGIGVDIGAAVIENLIVRGRVRGAAGYYSQSDFGDEVLFTFGGVGAGVDYYIMPINLYVGATISVAGIAREQEDSSHRSKAGIGIDLDIGKEWWIGRRWGLGIALRASFIDVPSANIVGDPSAHLRSLHGGLHLSATYN